MSFKRTFLACAATAVVGLGGCGEDEPPQQPPAGGGGGGGGGTPAAQTLRVTETEFKIDPANPSIQKTGPVEFQVRNAGQAPHALEVEGPGGEQETPTLQAGDSATLRVDFSRAGRYEWYCPIGNHRQQGMEGEVTVAGGGGDRPEDSGGDRQKREDDSSGSGGNKPEDDSSSGGGYGY